MKLSLGEVAIRSSSPTSSETAPNPEGNLEHAVQYRTRSRRAHASVSRSPRSRRRSRSNLSGATRETAGDSARSPLFFRLPPRRWLQDLHITQYTPAVAAAFDCTGASSSDALSPGYRDRRCRARSSSRPTRSSLHLLCARGQTFFLGHKERQRGRVRVHATTRVYGPARSRPAVLRPPRRPLARRVNGQLDPSSIPNFP